MRRSPGSLVSDPTQLTEGEPGCMFLLEGVTNPAESPLGQAWGFESGRPARAEFPYDSDTYEYYIVVP